MELLSGAEVSKVVIPCTAPFLRWMEWVMLGFVGKPYVENWFSVRTPRCSSHGNQPRERACDGGGRLLVVSSSTSLVNSAKRH